MPKTRNKNEILSHASGVVIHGSSFTNIGRNQYNNCIFQPPSAWPPGKRNKNLNLPQLSEFTEVKRGDICKDPSGVCYSWRLCSNGKDDTEAAVYHAEINIAGPFGQKKFTVKTYRGRNAMKEWHRDFLQCADPEDWCREIPLFGYNISSVPLLIFCGDLIPLVHIQYETNPSRNLMRVYFNILKNTLGCFLNELWMDPMSGKFRRGPAGPKCWNFYSDLRGINVPADVDFLKEGVFIRYLTNKKHNYSLLSALSYSGHRRRRTQKFRSFYPKVVSNSCNSTIAFNRNVVWRFYYDGSFHKNKVNQSGLARFRLKEDQRDLELRSVSPSRSWLAQTLSVFHAHGIRLDEDLSQYLLVYTSFILKGTLERSTSKQQRRELCDPIYFFLESCPSPDTHFYFWSHDPAGRNPLSLDMCNYFGLPFKLSLQADYIQKAWSINIYKALHEYQISTGFDPKTTDFAQCMRYQTWEVEPPENRFQEFDQDENNLPSTSQQSLLKPDNPPQSSKESADDKQPFSDDSYSLEMLFDGNWKREFTLTPGLQSPHSLNTVLIGNSSCRVMKRAQFPKLFTSYTHMFTSADQRSNPGLLLDLD